MKAEVRKSEARASKIRSLLKLRDKAEAEIATELRKALDETGEAKWLRWCEKEFGWSRTQAYAHLNPEQMQKDRDRAKAKRQRPDRPDIGPRDEEPDEITEEDERPPEAEAAYRRVHERWKEERQRKQERQEQERDRLMHPDDVAYLESKKADVKLAQDLVAAGYKALSKRFHPDTGGSHEAMIKLTRVRDALLGVLEHFADGSMVSLVLFDAGEPAPPPDPEAEREAEREEQRIKRENELFRTPKSSGDARTITLTDEYEVTR